MSHGALSVDPVRCIEDNYAWVEAKPFSLSQTSHRLRFSVRQALNKDRGLSVLARGSRTFSSESVPISLLDEPAHRATELGHA